MKQVLFFCICLLPIVTGATNPPATYIYQKPLLPNPTDAARLYIYDPVTNSDRNITWGFLRGAFAPIAPPWESISNKPSVFAPAAHTQGIETIIGLQAALNGKVGSTDPRLSDARQPLAHAQDIGTINGLQGILDAKQNALGFTPVADTDPRLSDARPPLGHDHDASAVAGLADVAISGSYNDLSDTPDIPVDATQIAYNGSTVAAVLDDLSYVPISITSYTLSGGGNITQELGSSYTITGSGLVWSTNKAATSQTVNGVAQTSPYMPPSPVSTNQTYTLQVGDGKTTASSTRTVTFTHKRYWGVSSSAAIDDAGIIALSSEFSTSRSQTRTMTAAGQYLYIVYVDTAGAGSFTVNGFADTSWQLTQRSFTNASGYTTTFRIYRSANMLTGTYTVVVS